jgi:hypothetical protein
MNDSSVALLGGVSAGATLHFSDFYGKSSKFVYSYTLPAGIADVNFNLSQRLTSAGWNGTSPVAVTISISGVLGSTSATTYAFDTGTGYAAGSTISVTVNSGGYISGAGGGTPGWNADVYNSEGLSGGAVANNGGNAMHVQVPITLTNNGIIQGGGGAGNGADDNYSGGGAGFFTGGHWDQTQYGGTWHFATLDSGSSFARDPGSGTSNGGSGGGWVATSWSPSTNGTGYTSPGTGEGPGSPGGVFTAGSAIVGRTNCSPVVPAQASTTNGTHYRGTVQ